MNIWLISMIIVALIIIGLAVFIAIRVRKRRETPNYRAWFIIGISWIPLGIATKNPVFYIVGTVFIIISLLNKDKWHQEKKWKDRTRNEKILKIVLVCIVVLMLIATLVLFLLRRKILFYF
jgi:beta-lactamase regulating signal transducer with metallopeptidase domain